MSFTNLPILLILALSVIGNNNTVAIAAAALLLLKLLGLTSWLGQVETHGITLGVIILTAGVLAPLASGKVDLMSFANTFKSPTGLIAISVGFAVAWIAGRGVSFMQASPEVVTAIMAGTLIGVCFFKGLAVGPLIAGGVVALLAGLFRL
ncbi:MAG: hypothetical protein CGU28_09675 [Candidatus Dactylopiibacterium carminicum]|uniref:UPF0756 membrane protein BGI27_11005 n=2 Tax=Candidatus Dactylopiibacterium carminicum TaxID=857335 RepID=A0A272ERP7_9RHOO|nr:DUF441 domain-containing protein [Candidatus Dactylopiibacterium carminicum]PAS92789.1 MAG: hypothetical protein CGU29_10265 [Candidatus Dactylopiibacterium carminicum]PAS96238.1 MAG: hypothetical protein CGU28_09675 [Candidatus Dactylopiibacterium carminicum]PAS98889.1 MAG: hypothetical protein BSR46_11025 [Candidatus Dactylopiibacterium carminicum]